jgi:glycosyltransferase involved in cell wall biosynthesis
MSISVLIPAYNAARTIEATLASVFRQTVQPDEIIVLWDGGTDDTLERIERFKDRITVARQENSGVAMTRNRLVAMAKGEILAFLDNDDLWHPKYLEVQRGLLRDYPEALASFCGHVDFAGADYVWPEKPNTDWTKAELMGQVEFIKRYYFTIGQFASMSFACVRKSAMHRMGPEPFQFSGADDRYLFYRVSLFGGVVYFGSPLVAYRVSEGSFSVNLLHGALSSVKACEKVAPEFEKSDVEGLRAVFPYLYAVTRRSYAKLLFGAGRPVEARRQLVRSMANCRRPVSVGKSLGMWALSWLPRFLQPKWPSPMREAVGVVGSGGLSSPEVCEGGLPNEQGGLPGSAP